MGTSNDRINPHTITQATSPSSFPLRVNVHWSAHLFNLFTQSLSLCCVSHSCVFAILCFRNRVFSHSCVFAFLFAFVDNVHTHFNQRTTYHHHTLPPFPNRSPKLGQHVLCQYRSPMPDAHPLFDRLYAPTYIRTVSDSTGQNGRCRRATNTDQRVTNRPQPPSNDRYAQSHFFASVCNVFV